jgi:hypothetical protein
MKVNLGRSATAKTLLPFLLYALGASSFAAVRTDPRLLSLVPAGSQLVAGMHQVGPDRQTASLLLLTDGNCLDFADFFAITGSDAARLVRLVIFTASARHDGEPPEHSLIASGRFDQERIFRSAKGGSNKTEYRGVPALVVSPFDRERDRLSEERWFVILGLHLALFGTVASITQEIDRYLDGTPPDSTILQRLARLRDQDDSWCLIAAPALGARGSQAFGVLDPALGDMIRRSRAFQYGIRFGRRVELDYDFNAPTISNPNKISDPQIQTPVAQTINASLFSAALSHATEDDANLSGMVKMSRSRYDKWLAKVSPIGGTPPVPSHP